MATYIIMHETEPGWETVEEAQVWIDNKMKEDARYGEDNIYRIFEIHDVDKETAKEAFDLKKFREKELVKQAIEEERLRIIALLGLNVN